MTDIEVLQWYSRERSPQAFDRLVKSHQGLVYGVCHRILENHHDVEDAVQDTFVKLAENAPSIRSNVSSWLHSCARRCALDRVRSLAARRDRERRWVEEELAQMGAEEYGELLALMDEVVGELDDKDRDMVVRYFYQSRTQEEIAREEGVSRVAVGKRLDKAVARLRERLGSRGVTFSAAFVAALLGQASAQAGTVPSGLNLMLQAIGHQYHGPATAAGAGIFGKAKGMVLGTVLFLILVLGGGVWWLGRSEGLQMSGMNLTVEGLYIPEGRAELEEGVSGSQVAGVTGKMPVQRIGQRVEAGEGNPLLSGMELEAEVTELPGRRFRLAGVVRAGGLLHDGKLWLFGSQDLDRPDFRDKVRQYERRFDFEVKGDGPKEVEFQEEGMTEPVVLVVDLRTRETVRWKVGRRDLMEALRERAAKLVEGKL